MSQPAFDFGDDELDDGANPTYTVGELAEAINSSFRRSFGDGIWVRGEITGWSDRGNHAYFTLADDALAGERNGAVINVQFFAPARMRLRPMLQKHRLRLADGMKVRVFGYLDYYPPTGRIGLKMTGIDPKYTLGDIAQSRDEIIRRLVADGLLDTNGRRTLSPVPLRIGAVTSVGTAAWHDFRHELETSGLGFQLSVVDVRVQGESAPVHVAAAIGTLARLTHLDAIVVIRGGGAKNELAVFDAEVIARTIAASPVPVLTGLGHEVDRSVADEVAHTALKTPTACAGELIDRVSAYQAATETAWRSIVRRAEGSLTASTNDISTTAHRIARHTHAAVERADERLAMRIDRLARIGPAATQRAEVRLAAAATRLGERSRATVERASGRLDVIAARVATLDPAVQVARGWSITRRTDGTIVRSVDELAPGDELTTIVIDGSIASTVRTLSPTPSPAPTPAVAPSTLPATEE
ncbi:MAG: exodeoxyribonuclease VII large subunit [Ilumatobacteraceae bacterium]